MPRSLIVQSSLNYFPADQPEATNFIHLPSTYTQYLQHLLNWRHIWNPVEQLGLSFFVEIVNPSRALVIFAEELRCGCLTGF